MKILVACEESQVVCKSFREKGHEAFSCDILPCSGGHPEWHIQGDVSEQLDKDWDMMIAHPPCTYLCNSGVRWLTEREGRWQQMRDGALFFKALLDADIPKIAVENPIPHKYALEIIGRKYDEIIQPWWFGDGETKATCLWLKNLPPLMATCVSLGRIQRIHSMGPSEDRGKERSKTYQGFASAMAQQWGT